MTHGDLLFLAAALALPGALLRVSYLLIRSRFSPAGRTLAWTLGGVALYFALLVAASWRSELKWIPFNKDRCFDDWCLAVEKSEHTREAGQERYKVTLRVSSRAARIRQRALDAEVFLADAQGHLYAPAKSRGPKLSELLEPMASFRTIRTFGLPGGATVEGLVVHHGYWPGRLIVGDSQSFLHKPVMHALK